MYRSSDAAGILAVDLACAESGDGMVLDREQIDRDLAVIDRRLLGSELQQVFVADVASEVAGYASVRKLFSGRVRHVAIAAVAVHPRFQRQGIGRALMRAAISWADTAQVSRLELYVRSDNARAIALYTSLGFELEGVRRGFIRTLRGELIDDFIMVRFAPQLDPAAS
ncbi:MAG: N-acetyltransferase family protein [Polyangiaceae bacterium]